MFSPPSLISITPCSVNDIELIFKWLTQSDLTSSMLGPPEYPDNDIPSLEDFNDDYKPYFFDGSAPKSGRCFLILLDDKPIGQVNHDRIYFDGSTELDIWMASSEYTGKGYGTQALNLICVYLLENFDCHEFFIAPSLRNLRAIKSYLKAGFQHYTFPPAWFQPDYFDAYLMRKLI